MILRREKIIFVIGGMVLILAGVIIGSFLVLRSATSQGLFYDITNETAKLQQQATGALLNELSNIQTELEQDQVLEHNLTQEFLDTLAQEAVEKGLSQDDLTSEEFFLSTVLPFLKENTKEIIPEIRNEEINISALTDSSVYFEDVQIHILLLAGAWQKIALLNPESLIEPETREMFGDVARLLKLNDEELRSLIVPIDYVSFHKKILQFSTAMQILTNNVLIS